MEPIVVRKAQQADIPAILEIEWECFREDSFSKEQFAYLISRSKGTFYVMMEADRVIAYVSLLFHGGTRYLRIYSIAVHPDYRGRGLGQVLMDQTIQTAGECKAAKITLEVKVTNTSAIGLYMKNGFIPVGVKPNYYHVFSRNPVYLLMKSPFPRKKRQSLNFNDCTGWIRSKTGNEK